MTVDPLALALDLVRVAGLALAEAMPTPAPTGPVVSLAGLAVRIVAVGWATVDLDRALAELAEPGLATTVPDVRDELLGAHGRWLSPSPASEPVALIVLEPFTEGRLAAGLARRGEGPAALYLVPLGRDLAVGIERLAATRIRTRLGTTALGAGALLLGRAADGPHLLLVAVPSEP